MANCWGNMALWMALASPATGWFAATSPRMRKRVFSDFVPLVSPAEYSQKVLQQQLMHSMGTDDDQITVVKFTSESCRACRQVSTKIRTVMREWDGATRRSSASFYSMELRRAAPNSESMLDFFMAHNVTHLPLIELYVGETLWRQVVVPPGHGARPAIERGSHTRMLPTFTNACMIRAAHLYTRMHDSRSSPRCSRPMFAPPLVQWTR
jgi:hypothetical protein